jgi:hypothetical protein
MLPTTKFKTVKLPYQKPAGGGFNKAVVLFLYPYVIVILK